LIIIKLDGETDELLEYIDGVIYNQASPSIKHQRVSHKLSRNMDLLFFSDALDHYITEWIETFR
jgi:Uma2 family endonuclease